MLQTTTVTQKGQVTVPAYLRQKLKIKTGNKVIFLLHPVKPGQLVMKPVPALSSFKGVFKSAKKYSKGRLHICDSQPL